MADYTSIKPVAVWAVQYLGEDSIDDGVKDNIRDQFDGVEFQGDTITYKEIETESYFDLYTFANRTDWLFVLPWDNKITVLDDATFQRHFRKIDKNWL